MPLTQDEINKSAVMAQWILKGKTQKELRALSIQLRTQSQQRAFAERLHSQLQEGTGKTKPNSVSIDLAQDVVQRLCSSIEQRLNAASTAE